MTHNGFEAKKNKQLDLTNIAQFLRNNKKEETIFEKALSRDTLGLDRVPNTGLRLTPADLKLSLSGSISNTIHEPSQPDKRLKYLCSHRSLDNLFWCSGFDT